jgi:hypothetical protein
LCEKARRVVQGVYKGRVHTVVQRPWEDHEREWARLAGERQSPGSAANGEGKATMLRAGVWDGRKGFSVEYAME